MNINPSEHISEKLDNDAEAREEFDAVLDSDHFRDYEAEDLPIEFDDDDGFDLNHEELDDADMYTDDYEWHEADADAWHSQWD